ncbi:MAG: hypothetical protein H7327_14765 [Herminiimonas sp.]|nr:hypothetical protein [Herminiimonas sp.]
MRSTRATAAVERLKVRTSNPDYSLVLGADGQFQLVLATDAGRFEKIGAPVALDEFVAFVNGYGPQTPRRMTKSDVAFEKQLVKKSS